MFYPKLFQNELSSLICIFQVRILLHMALLSGNF